MSLPNSMVVRMYSRHTPGFCSSLPCQSFHTQQKMSYNATDASFLSVLTVVHKACNIIPQCEKSEISKLAARQPTLRTEVPTACGKAPGTAHSCLQIFTTCMTQSCNYTMHENMNQGQKESRRILRQTPEHQTLP